MMMTLKDMSVNAREAIKADGAAAAMGIDACLGWKASIEIEEEDKRRKRRLAITEASNNS